MIYLKELFLFLLRTISFKERLFDSLLYNNIAFSSAGTIVPIRIAALRKEIKYIQVKMIANGVFCTNI